MSVSLSTQPAAQPLRRSLRVLVSLLVVLSLTSVSTLAYKGGLSEKKIVEALVAYFGSTFETAFGVDNEDGEEVQLALEIEEGRVTTFTIDGEDRPLTDIEPYLDNFQDLSVSMQELKHERLVLAEEALQLKAELSQLKEMQQKIVLTERSQLNEERLKLQKELKALAETRERLEKRGEEGELSEREEREVRAMERKMRQLKDEHLVLRETQLLEMREELEVAHEAQRAARAELKLHREEMREARRVLAGHRVDLERTRVVMTAIEERLVADGLIEEGDAFELEIDVEEQVLRINGEDASEEQYQTYKYLIEDARGKPLDDRFHVHRN